MGKKYVLVDDYDGQELPDDTSPVSLSLGTKRYSLYLSDDNHGKLLEVLEPFIKDAEIAYDHSVTRARQTASNAEAAKAEKERNKKVREWAIDTQFKYKNAKGEEVTLGDRGRIPQEVFDAYDEANPS